MNDFVVCGLIVLIVFFKYVDGKFVFFIDNCDLVRVWFFVIGFVNLID